MKAVKHQRSNRKYPWERWLSPGTKTTLREGRDFGCRVHGMAQQVRNAAVKYGVSVSVQYCGDGTLVIQAHKRG